MLFTNELERLFKETWKRLHGWEVYDTNRGWCYQFAVVLSLLFPQAVYHWDYGHCWVEIDGKLYDSTVPFGTNDVWGLACACSPMFTGTIKELEEFWQNGGSGRVNWEVINHVVDSYRQMGLAA